MADAKEVALLIGTVLGCMFVFIVCLAGLAIALEHYAPRSTKAVCGVMK